MRRRLAARLVSDRRYLSALYRAKFGALPNLGEPRGFNEKILVKILTDRRSFLTLAADKLRVRDYVRACAPDLALPSLIWWSDNAESLPFDELPHEFVLKANHGSGWVRLVEERQHVTKERLVELAKTWLSRDFTVVGREWAYRDVHRAVYVEELLRDARGCLPADFKLFVFSGAVRLIQVDRDRFGEHTQALYDPHWTPIEGTVAARQGARGARPTCLTQMIRAAEKLSAGIDFVRIDLYDVRGRVYFGEITNYPNKGLSPFRPATLDRLLGDWLTLDPDRPLPFVYRPETFSVGTPLG
jgi:hypothetical protein